MCRTEDKGRAGTGKAVWGLLAKPGAGTAVAVGMDRGDGCRADFRTQWTGPAEGLGMAEGPVRERQAPRLVPALPLNDSVNAGPVY